MKIKDIILFTHINNIEYHWTNENNQKDVIIFIHDAQLSAFRDLLLPCDYEDEGLPTILKDGYMCIYMQELLEGYEIELNDVFDIGK